MSTKVVPGIRSAAARIASLGTEKLIHPEEHQGLKVPKIFEQTVESLKNTLNTLQLSFLRVFLPLASYKY